MIRNDWTLSRVCHLRARGWTEGEERTSSSSSRIEPYIRSANVDRIRTFAGGSLWLGANGDGVTQEPCCMASRPRSGVKVGDIGALIGRGSEMPEDAAVARILAVSRGVRDQSKCSIWREETPTHKPGVTYLFVMTA